MALSVGAGTDESDVDSALVYYRYSDLIAGALQFTSPSGTQNSRYIGIPEIEVSIFDIWFTGYAFFFIFSLFAGLVIGIIIGLVIGVAIFKKQEKKPPTKKLVQQSLDGYYRKQSEYFPDGNIPRSIKDYYKKGKK